MNEQILPESKNDNGPALELGFALGQSHTFGLVAGRCSAAQAQGIRRLREEKLYKQCCGKWDDFCPKYLKMSHGEADRIVRHLEEFGPTYFELSQLTRISAETFRAIAPAITEGVLHHNGEGIALTSENWRKVASAVSEMRGALPKKSPDPAELAREVRDLSREPDLERRIHNMAQRCIAIVGEIDRLARDERLRVSRIALRHELTRVRDEIIRVAA